MIYEPRDPASDTTHPKQSATATATYGFNPYPQPKTFMEMTNQYSSEYATTMGQGYDQPHYFSSNFSAPNMSLSEESYMSQNANTNMENTDYTYEKKEPKCICKQTHNRIPRPRNAFILFRQRYHRSVFDESTESKTNPQVSQELGRRWRALSVKERDHWNNLAEEERQEHAKKYPNYRYTPRRKGKYKHCQVCYGKKDNRGTTRQVKRMSPEKPVAQAHQTTLTAKASVSQLSSYHYQYQPPQPENTGKQQPQGDMQTGMTQPYLAGLQAQPSLQQTTQSRLSSRGGTSHTPLDNFQYLTFAQTMYPPLNQYGYMDNNYMSGSHAPNGSGLQAGSAVSMHPSSVSRRSSIFARAGNTIEYESSQVNEVRGQPVGGNAAVTATSSDSYPLPTSMQQYLVSFNKTALRKVS